MLLSGTMLSFKANAQKFTRTIFNDPYIPITISGGAIESSATGDNGNETGIPLGFNFIYADSVRTQIGLNTNGLLWFDATAPSASDGSNINRMFNTSGANEGIGAWFANMQDDATSQILYQTSGTLGSQKFVVQYSDYPHYSGAAGLNIRINFQVVLYEGSNVIEFRYGTISGAGPAATAGGACIAIEYGSGGEGNFLDLVTGSRSTTHGMLSPLMAWPTYNYRMTPGVPAPVAAGTYNVGIGQTYQNLTIATSELNHRGIAGPVTLNLVDDNYDITPTNGSNIFPIFVGPVEGTSAVNTLTISKAGNPATLSYKGSPVVQGGFGSGSGLGSILDSEEPILGVSASYVTIRNLNLVSLGVDANDVEVGLMVFEAFGGDVGAQHNLFDQISIDMDRTNTGTIAILSNNISNPGGLAGSNSFNTYRDIVIRDSYAGINLQGAGGVYTYDSGNQIISSDCNLFNSIGDPNNVNDLGGGSSPSYGIWMQNQSNFVIKNNLISSISSTSNVSAVDGIWIPAGGGVNEIANNIIRNLKRNSTSLNAGGNVSGIRIASPNSANVFKIYNNNISGLTLGYSDVPTATRGVKGIYIDDTGAGAVNYEIWNNTVSIDGSSAPNASYTCFEIAESGSRIFTIKNNVFANFTSSQTAPAAHFAFVAPDVDRFGALVSQSDYNNFFIANDAGVSGHIGLGDNTIYSSLASWQSGMSFHTNTDQNSQNGNPFFLNNITDLHATALSVSLDGNGTTPPVYVTTDIDCQIRNTPHDIGSDDFGICTPEAGSITPSSATICAGNTYSIDAIGFSTEPGTAYQWMVSTVSGGPYTNVANGGTSTSYTTDALSAGTYYFVMQTSCSGPGTDLTNEFTLTVLPLPEPVITPSGATTFCEGGSVTLDAGSYTNYSWSTGSNNQSINVTQSGSYSVTVTDANGCSAASPSVTVTVNPLPVVMLDPFASVCSTDAPFNLTGGSPSGGSYSGNGVGAGIFNPATAGIGIHVITYSYTDTNGCSNNTTATIEVTDCGCIPPAPITAINGQFGVCQGQSSVTFSVANDPNATSYVWTLPNGLTGTSTTNSITVNVSSTYTNANICVVASNICGQTQQYCRLVSQYTVKPAKPNPIIGSVIACNGSTQTYSVSQSNNVIAYAWTVPSGSLILSGQGTNTIEVQFGNVNPGDYIGVTASNCIGTSAMRILGVSGLPKTPNEAIGLFPRTGICPNGTYNYGVVPVVSVLDYTWAAPAGAIISDGVINANPLTTTSANVQITFPTGFVSGTVEVVASNACGSSGVRSVFVRAFTNTPGNINGPRFAMCGTTSQSYSVTPVVGATSYIWAVPVGATIVGPSNGSSISVDFDSNFDIGSICVTAVNVCGNSTERCLVVQGRPGPPNPITGPLAVCKNGGNYNYSVLPFPGASTYLWQGSNGVIVTGNTENVALNFLNVNTPTSTISARAFNACGKSEKSFLQVQVDNCRFEGELVIDELIVSPNPASESVAVSFRLEQSMSTMITISDLNGRNVIVETYNCDHGLNQKSLDVSKMAPGAYILSVTNDAFHKQFKIVVL